MNTSTKLLSLLSPPPPPLFLFRRLFIRPLTNLRRFHRLTPSSSDSNNHISPTLLVSLPITQTFPISRFHTHRVHVSTTDYLPYYHSRLPEWTELLQSLSEAGYFSDSTAISGLENELLPGLPDELIRPVLACLALARDRPDVIRMLSRTDVEVVVENGNPFLFRTGLDSLKRLSLYIRNGHQGSTVDLMKLLLSYVVDFVSSEVSKHHNVEIMESSVKNLLSEIAKMSFRTVESNVHGTMENKLSDRNGQGSGSFQKNIEMKRGDWICSRCNGLNFARNVKCFQCDEARPKRQLTGSEWECPQCDFYNYGRNVACLRCDCKHPGNLSVNNSANSGHSKDPELERRLAENEEIMPLRKGVNRFVVNTRKTPIERTLPTNGDDNKAFGSKTNRSLNEIIGSSQVVNSGFVPFVPLPSDMFAKKPDKEETQTALSNDNQMDDISDENRNVYQGDKSNETEEKEPAKWYKRVTELHNVSESEEMMPMRKGENRFVVSRKKDRSLTTPANKRRTSIDSEDPDFVPFVPFPPDYFAKEKQPKEPTTDPIPSPATENASQAFKEPSRNNHEPMYRNGKSLEGSLVKEVPDLLDMSEEAKAERWFKRVADIKNISELTEIPDEDFPSIMPMRKGVNRFVVSKRKTPLERRLASQRQQINPYPNNNSDDPASKRDT